jgi:tetratricopeptide (TPR) repeat protein
LALVQKLKQGFNPPPIPQLQDVSNNILGEPRAFYITSQMDLQKIQFMMMSEQQARGAIGPDLKPHNVIEKYSKMLKEKGWNVVRPALSVSVRGMIVIAHVHTITGNFVEAYQTLKKALKILELADEKWPKTENPERGASLEHTFIRKVKSTLIQYIGYTVRESSNPDVEYMKELCDQVLVCCKTRPVDLKDSGWHFWMCYHQYCIAEAHMGLAHYHKIKGMKNKHESELGYHEYDSEHLKQAIVHYQFAVNWYPEDEHYRCVAAWSMLDCMIFKGGHTLNQLIEYQQVALEQDARLFPVWGYYAKRSEFANEQIEVLKKRFDQSGLSYDLVVPKMKEIITEDVDEARRVLADLQERNSANEFQDEITFFSVLAKTKKDKEDVGADIDL